VTIFNAAGSAADGPQALLADRVSAALTAACVFLPGAGGDADRSFAPTPNRRRARERITRERRASYAPGRRARRALRGRLSETMTEHPMQITRNSLDTNPRRATALASAVELDD
jgi:hypothetical protein